MQLWPSYEDLPGAAYEAPPYEKMLAELGPPATAPAADKGKGKGKGKGKDKGKGKGKGKPAAPAVTEDAAAVPQP